MHHRKVDSSELWRRFQEWREEQEKTRDATLQAARRQREIEQDAAQGMADARTLIIRNMVTGTAMKRVLHALNRAEWQRHQKEIQSRYQSLQAKARAENVRHTSWRDWLNGEALRGDTNALAVIRARDERPRTNPVVPVSDAVKITRKGTVLYNAGARDSGLPLTINQHSGFHQQVDQKRHEYRSRGR